MCQVGSDGLVAEIAHFGLLFSLLWGMLWFNSERASSKLAFVVSLSVFRNITSDEFVYVDVQYASLLKYRWKIFQFSFTFL